MTRNSAEALGLQLQMYRKEVLDSASLTRWSQASDDDFSKLLRDLKGYLDKEMFLQNVRRVLGSLHFDQIRMRHSDVKHAHRNSYEWIFSGDQRRDMPSFPAWLRSGHGMFWITGKAGSGKSTLVKFLCSHAKTRGLLAEWAAPQKCVIGSHFFWNIGSRLQKSQEGLLRTILFQVWDQCPELIPDPILE
jgi:hypothetical protein